VPRCVVSSRVENFRQYLAECPTNTRAQLREGEVLVSFGAFKSHIGFYPGAAAIAAFRPDLKEYTTAKGSVQFPLGEPLPLELIKKIVRFKCERLS
jgi:uncharacterized protein YdhG (YjbR/CyaY superfamily)